MIEIQFRGSESLSVQKEGAQFRWSLKRLSTEESILLTTSHMVLQRLFQIPTLLSYDTRNENSEVIVTLPTFPKVVLKPTEFGHFLSDNHRLIEGVLEELDEHTSLPESIPQLSEQCIDLSKIPWPPLQTQKENSCASSETDDDMPALVDACCNRRICTSPIVCEKPPSKPILNPEEDIPVTPHDPLYHYPFTQEDHNKAGFALSLGPSIPGLFL